MSSRIADQVSMTGHKFAALDRDDLAIISAHLQDALLMVGDLAVTFVERDAPSGEIVLSFSGGGEIRLAVECLEVAMVDGEAVWGTAQTPHHDLSTDGV